MSQFNIEELVSLGEEETKTKLKYSNSSKTVTKLPPDTVITHHGEIIGTLSNIEENLRCDCPEGYLHSDKLGEDYAHTIRLSGGEIGISCSGDSCTGLFVPNTPMKQPSELDIPTPQKLDIGQLDTVPLRHFTAEMIPEPIRHWTLDNCMHSESSFNYGAVTAIVVCSNLIGMGCQMRPKCNGYWTVTPNLWGMVIGEPSKRKSPAVEQFLKPLKMLEAKSAETFNAKLQKYEEEKSEQSIAEKAKKKALEKAYESGDEKLIASAKSIYVPNVEEPKMERFIVNDATTEKLGELMSVNPRTILQYRDELAGFLASFTKAGREGDRAFYLESFNGDSPYTSDRIGRGTIHIERLSIGLFGTIQPSVLAKYIIAKNGGSGDGLAQRMQLAVFPDDVSRPYYDEPVDSGVRESAYELLERLAYESYEQMPGAQLSYEGIPYFQFDNEAQERFIQWYNNMKQKEKAEADVNIQAHIGKYYSLLPALALTFFLIDKVAGVCDAHAITLPHVELAIEWCNILETHARKMYQLSEEKDEVTLNQKIISYVRAHQDELPKTFGELSGDIRGAHAKDVENALDGIVLVEGRKVIKLL